LNPSGSYTWWLPSVFFIRNEKNEKIILDGNDFEGDFLPLLMQVEYLIICCAVDENEFKLFHQSPQCNIVHSNINLLWMLLPHS
jgi:hypothetical protein